MRNYGVPSVWLAGEGSAARMQATNLTVSNNFPQKLERLGISHGMTSTLTVSMSMAGSAVTTCLMELTGCVVINCIRLVPSHGDGGKLRGAGSEGG